MSKPKKPKKPKPCSPCKGTGEVVKYSLLQPFNPHSGDQVANLIKELGLKMPRKRGEDRETTEAKYLKRFAKRFPVFQTILDCREKQKAISTYVYPTNSQGRVTTTFGFHPSTWRKSSRNVNLQNIPIRNPEMADAIRATMVAPPGHVLIEADYEGIEAVIVGVCAGDQKYVRICKAGLHGFAASHRMGVGIDPNLPFDDLRRQCKGVKKSYPKEYDEAKRGNHGANYGLSPYGLFDEFKETFPTQKLAKEYLDFYFGLFPSLRRWQNNTLEVASRQTYLDNHYGGRHYFYHVKQWNKSIKEWTIGEDGKRAISYVPQSDASFIQNIDVLEGLDADPITEPLGRLLVHDSTIVEVPLELVEYTCNLLHTTMGRGRPELGGVSIGVEIAVGEDLRKKNMNTWQPKEGQCPEGGVTNGLSAGRPNDGKSTLEQPAEKALETDGRSSNIPTST